MNVLAFDDIEQGADYQLFSASQIDTFLDCRRKWAWDKIARLPRGQHVSAKVGDRVHKQLEGHLDGQPLDFTEVVNHVKIGDVCASGIHFLPEPATPGPKGETPAEQRARHARHGFAIETEFRWQSSSTNIVYTGRKDLEVFDSRSIPGLDLPCDVCDDDPEGCSACNFTGRIAITDATKAPAVLDHKSTSSLGWAKTPNDLDWDVQANLYAYDVIARTGSPRADLVWVYYQTKGAKASKRVHLRVTREDAIRKFALIQSVAVDMATIKKRAPRWDSAPREGLEGPPDMGGEWRAANAAFVEGISPNGAACEKFGGCSYRHVCRLSPTEGAFSFMSTNPDALFDSLRKRAAAQDGVAITDKKAPELPPTCAREEVPAPTAPPAWATAPVDPLSLKKSASAVVPPAINPPESTLPPPVTPPPAATAPAAPSEEPAPTTKGKRGPGRPRKGATAKDPTGADVELHTGAPPKPVDADDPNAVYAMSNEAAQAAVDRAVATCETPAQEPKCPPWFDTHHNLVLFVDCIPSNPKLYENVDKYIAEARERIAATDILDDRGNPQRYADYRFIPFGKGAGVLSLAVAELVAEAKPVALFLSTATPEGAVVLSALAAKAALVVRGLR